MYYRHRFVLLAGVFGTINELVKFKSILLPLIQVYVLETCATVATMMSLVRGIGQDVHGMEAWVRMQMDRNEGSDTVQSV